MKAKFLLLSFLLLFARGCDFYSTTLWYFDNPSHETNPLSSILGFGWKGLVVANLIIVSLILFAHYYYSFKHSIVIPSYQPKNLTEYISEIYYNQKNKFYQVFYKFPINKRILIAHNGYVLIRAAIIGSFLAAIHNLCLFYNVPIYDAYNKMVGWPEYVVYFLIVLSIIYFTHRIWKKEYSYVRRKLSLY